MATEFYFQRKYFVCFSNAFKKQKRLFYDKLMQKKNNERFDFISKRLVKMRRYQA